MLARLNRGQLRLGSASVAVVGILGCCLLVLAVGPGCPGMDGTTPADELWVDDETGGYGAKTGTQQPNCVNGADICNRSIGPMKCMLNVFGSGHIQNKSIESWDLADNAVGSRVLGGASVDTVHLADEAVTYAKLADPLDLDSGIWDINISAGFIDIDQANTGPALEINNYSMSYADCLELNSTSGYAHSSTQVLRVGTYKGWAAVIAKSTDDARYALWVVGADEGIHCQGDFLVQDGTKSGAVETSQGREAIFCVEGPEVEIYCAGTASLDDGSAYVEFDRLFMESVSTEIPIRVTVTPIGGWSGLYLESTSPQGFEVATGAGDKDIDFHWMACGRRKGYEARPHVTVPDPNEDALRRRR